MRLGQIRLRALDFFAQRRHEVLPSASLISPDPSVLFTIAGMLPLAPYFTGQQSPPFKRAVSCQNCLRTLDIDEVGKTARHGTFFQMLGNFSFGDYFKAEAIDYAWTFLTLPEGEAGLGFDPKRLWVTVYEEDDQAYRLWLEISGLNPERIQRLGRETNFWDVGHPGPAGPCSEIFYDRGPEYGPEGGPATDSERYLEIWNLVFMQYMRGEGSGKNYPLVGNLPSKNIDTGMGLERVAMIKQGVESLFEIDQIKPLINRTATLAQVTYGASLDRDVRLRIVADHIRSSLMLLHDGLTPSNAGRGYVLRRLLRRALRSLRLLGIEKPVLGELFTTAKAAMQENFPSLNDRFDRVLEVALGEEEAFLRTLSSGMGLLEEAIGRARTSRGSLSGKDAFMLHDTYGFPIDLTVEIAQEAGLSVERKAFETLMAEQKARAKSDALARDLRGNPALYRDLNLTEATAFLGYELLESESEVLGLIQADLPVGLATAAQEVQVILDQTPFYPQGGGQEPDKGLLLGKDLELEVLSVTKPFEGLIVHHARVLVGEIILGQKLIARVDEANRRSACQAHSATHVIHACLGDLLGPAATQAGSLNRAGYMRFDFSWNRALESGQKEDLEEAANQAVDSGLEVLTQITTLEEARRLGAKALFSEKYGNKVRMVEIGGAWSRELCAGTHVQNSGQIGLINLISESSVGAGNRRVECLVGVEALRGFVADRALVHALTGSLKISREKLVDRVTELATSVKTVEKKLIKYEEKSLCALAKSLADQAGTYTGISAVIAQVELIRAENLRKLVQNTSQRLGECVVVLAASIDKKPRVVIASSPKAQSKGLLAGVLVAQVAKILEGAGGGAAGLASGGGRNPQKLAPALEWVRTEIKRGLSS